MIFPPTTNRCPHSRGVSFVDVLVGSALMIIVFLGVFGAFKLSLALNASVRARTGALALANERMEYLRALPYASLGTLGGIPAGLIPQNETRVLNGMTYTQRTFIQYADDPADGFGALDTNHITADYKIIKVALTWSERGVPRAYALVGRVSPKGMESTVGGGTLSVRVTDSMSVPLQGALVRIVNSTVSPAVDTASFTGADGDVSFPGAPSGGGYQITVSKSWYSSAQTYGASVGNPNPSPAHVSVATSSTSLITFAIDHLAGLVLKSFSPPNLATSTETFASEAGLAGLSFATLSGGDLIIAFDGAAYPAHAEAVVVPIAPARLIAWDTFSATSVLPPSTALSYQFVTGSVGAFTPVPDSDLPGNSAGFTVSSVDLSGLATSTYPGLGVKISLDTTDPLATPHLAEIALSYLEGPNPLPTVSFSLRGAKIIGAGPVYKTSFSTTTNAEGVREIFPLEWDTYTIVPESAYAVAEACPAEPFMVPAGATTTLAFTLVASSPHTLRVLVRDNANLPIGGATVTVSATSSPAVLGTTSSCGQVFFPNHTPGIYSIEAQKTGYIGAIDNDISVSEQTLHTITLTHE